MSATTGHFYSPECVYDTELVVVLDESKVEALTRHLPDESERVLEALGASAWQAFEQTFSYRWTGEDTLDWGNVGTWILSKWMRVLVARPPDEKFIEGRLLPYDALREFVGESSRLRELFEPTLIIAAEMGDETAFVEVAERIDWSQRPPIDFVRGVRLALSAGAHLLARNLAIEGARLYPGHVELRKMTRILAPARVVNADVLPTPSVGANQAWLRDHADEYKGQWVALREGTLLAAGATARGVWNRLESTDGVMLTKVF